MSGISALALQLDRLHLTWANEGKGGEGGRQRLDLSPLGQGPAGDQP